MGKIRILSDEIASKIAAGEIVERPASALKELIENSLDAGSTEIRIGLRKGGKKLISVTDDGEGMTRDDALLSLERHATSKIKDAKEIFSVKTLGFRGEAIPSIASVSRVRLTTRAKGEIVGTRIHLEGGTIKNVEEAGCPEGTSVEVRDLFYNTPPRLKFMKTEETELSHLLDAVQRGAISYPEVGFEVTNEGKTLLRLPKRESLKERTAELFPDAELFEVKAETEYVKVYGFMSQPEDKRTTTQKLYTYVNRRAVRDRFLTRMVIDAYGRLIERGKFPQGVLFLEVPTEDVDVNVHPTKNEVRFRRAGAVGDSIKAAIGEMLRDAPWIKDYRGRVENAVQGFFERRVAFEVPQLDEPRRFLLPERETTPFPASTESHERTEVESLPPSAIRSHFNPNGNAPPDLFKEDGFFSRLGIIGQLRGLYIVCESEIGMILIDQHAAHEKITYEKLKKAYLKRELEVQELLLPVLIHLSPSESGVLEEHKGEVESLGIRLENFGTNSFLARSVPVLLKGADVEKLVKDVIGEIAALGKENSLSGRVDHVIATMACHSSIRANSELGGEKLRALLRDLDGAEAPHSCPHGRPVATGFTFEEIEKLFKRT